MTVNLLSVRVKTCQYLQIFTTTAKEEQTVTITPVASRSRMSVEIPSTGKVGGKSMHDILTSLS